MYKQQFEWLNEHSELFLKRGYLQEGKEPKQRIRDIAEHAEKLLDEPGFADKFYDYMSLGFYSLASPVWSNFGTDRGLPVSCFGSYIDDDIGSILKGVSEVGTMSKFGGGCSGYFGDVRPRGSKIGNDNGESSGSVHFMELYESLTNVISQGSVRRGFFSPYLPIEHGDADEFIGVGTDGHPIQQLTHGLTVTDEFIKQLKNRDIATGQKWAKVIQTRREIGYPYILFIDNFNNNTVDVYKDKGMKIHASNMCTEIGLPSSIFESFVCVLSSINIFQWEALKNTDAVEVLTRFLDAVVTEFLIKLEALRDSEDRADTDLFHNMERSYNFAKNHRALGIGTLGWHSFLQDNMIPFESGKAAELNYEIHKHIEERSWAESKRLAEKFGEPEVLKGYGRRNTTLTAVAPTKSSSFILGQVSQSIEPEFSNYYVKDLAKTKVTIKNPFLTKVLKEVYDKDNYETWKSIKEYDGSVQHLDFMSEEHKDIFKTFGEIDPYTILNQASVRQDFVDQSQSLNLRIGPSMSVKEINQLYLYAHEMGIKSLYYQFSTSAAQELARTKGCASCEA